MTNEKAIMNLESWQIDLPTNSLQFEVFEKAIKALKRMTPPDCEDGGSLTHEERTDEEVITLRKGVLKAVTGRYVVYDREWLKEHFNTTEAKIYGAEPCEDCISRRAAIEYFMTNTNWHDEDGDEIDDADEKRKLLEDYFSGVQPVTPARKKGKWIWDKRTGEYECSECGCNPIYEGIAFDYSEIDKYRYCRWCGAEMEVEE